MVHEEIENVDMKFVVLFIDGFSDEKFIDKWNMYY